MTTTHTREIKRMIGTIDAFNVLNVRKIIALYIENM